MNEEEKQRLVDKVISVIKNDIADGDVEALDELLKFCPTENLFAFLPEYEQKEFQNTEKDIFEKDIFKFKKDWGQSHDEICANLEYDKDASEDLLMLDYFWLDDTKQWYPKSSSSYTEREQEIADLLRLYS